MSWLVDTNVISAASPAKTAPDLVLAEWLTARIDAISLSAITIFEIEDGIARLLRQGASRQAQAFRQWLDWIETAYAGRVLPVDMDVARIGGRLSDKARGAGVTIGYPDLLIAATAAHHGLTIATRNLRHFAPLGVHAVDPAAG